MSYIYALTLHSFLLLIDLISHILISARITRPSCFVKELFGLWCLVDVGEANCQSNSIAITFHTIFPPFSVPNLKPRLRKLLVTMQYMYFKISTQCLSQLLILSGDIETNPGPGEHFSQKKCILWT